MGIGRCTEGKAVISTKNFTNGSNLGNKLGPCAAKAVEMKLIRNEEVKELGGSRKMKII